MLLAGRDGAEGVAVGDGVWWGWLLGRVARVRAPWEVAGCACGWCGGGAGGLEVGARAGMLVGGCGDAGGGGECVGLRWVRRGSGYGSVKTGLGPWGGGFCGSARV